MRRRRARRRGDAVIELTPLIDMVFILLIFFIVTTAFVKETGVRVEKPESGAAGSVGGSFVLLAVTRGGSVHAGGRRIRPDDPGTIGRLLAEAGASRVVIQADRDAPLGLVLRVQDAARAAGARDVRVGARRK